ncbi:MAG: AAA family ATPase [Candidatus Binatia bacterium]
MYAHFYRLVEDPFNLTPDPRFHYVNSSTQEALASVLYGIRSRKGFVTLVGEAGTGKTTLLRRVVEEIDEEATVVFVFNPGVSFNELLEYICMELGIETEGCKRLVLLERLNQYLLDSLVKGTNVVVIIDEAQTLDESVLEELRLLTNLETSKEKILQIVLAGQPELAATLRKPSLRQLRQRVGVRAVLKPMMPSEIGRYVKTRLRGAGAERAEIFTPTALRKIWKCSQGIPRLINVVCDNAMMIAFADGRQRVSGRIMKEAISDLEGVERSGGLYELGRVVGGNAYRYAAIAAIAAAALALAVPLLSGYSPGWLAGLEAYVAHEPGVVPVEENTTAEARADARVTIKQPTATPSLRGDAGDGGTKDAAAASVSRASAQASAGISALVEEDDSAPALQAPEVSLDASRLPQPVAVEAAEAAPAVDSPKAVGTFSDPPVPSVEDSTRLAELIARSTAARLYAGRPKFGFDGPAPRAKSEARPAETPAPRLGRKVLIRSGDTIWDIALAYYGNAGSRTLAMIMEHNSELSDPRKLVVGSTMDLPFRSAAQMISQDRDGSWRILLSASPNRPDLEAVRRWAQARGEDAMRLEIRRDAEAGVPALYALGYESSALALGAAQDVLRKSSARPQGPEDREVQVDDRDSGEDVAGF